MENQNRIFLPEFLPRRLRDQQIWFLKNFEVEFLCSSYWKNPSPWSTERRKIMDNFIVFPNAPMYVATDREQKIVDRGEFFIIPQGHWHSFGLEPDIAKHSEHIILHALFHSDIYLNLLDLFPSYFHKLENYDCWYEKLKKVICLHEHNYIAEKKYAEIIINELILELLRLEGENIQIPERSIDIRIESVIRFIKDNYSDDLLIEDLAEKAGLRPVQFRKLFKRETKESPKTFLNSVRISNAIHMLRKTSMKVSSISERTGFNDKNYFSAVFKRTTGMTPTRFREVNESVTSNLIDL